MTNLAEQRYTAVHLLRAGHSVSEVAKQLQSERSVLGTDR
jgi:transposase